MKRGDLYRVYRGSKNDPKEYRVFLVVSRQLLIDTHFSTVICAPVYTKYGGLPTQVEIGVDEGLKHDSAVNCDDLVSIPKTLLTDYIGIPRTSIHSSLLPVTGLLLLFVFFCVLCAAVRDLTEKSSAPQREVLP